MKIRNSVALVTGANRGIGLAFTRELLALGLARCTPAPETLLRSSSLVSRLSALTKPEEVMAAAAHAGDVTLIVNNAGRAHPGGFLASDSEDGARRDLETNFFGILRVTKAFAPILAANGGGAFLNVLSVASWINSGALGPYAASKSAAWSLTNSLRFELAPQKTQVLALHMGFVDTDLARGVDAPKTSADEIVKRALDALESGLDEVLADERARLIKQGLTAPRSVYLPQTA
jgi:NAD(P)-dependent dehydrogenase (short-subunit alcohol dehydrogenase family)